MKRLLVSCLAAAVLAAPAFAADSAAKDKKAETTETKKKDTKGKAAKVGQAPEQFKVTFETTKGKFVVEAHRDWSPKGVDRFYEMVQEGFFKDIAFFRVVKGFVVQFGIHGNPDESSKWKQKVITDDAVKESNKSGYLTFATAGPNTRTTQLFINLNDNTNLDRMGFSPFAKVVEGMDVVNNINGEYGERPNQGAIQSEGNSYLKKTFPNMDYIKTAKVAK
ncbi:MAG: peptidylprolyl isomerase [Bdellovibrionaceae bacterium]|nr:peptidylprolyl isomerase [Bdellovibrionales bacterium]MCB9084066.1 peptidylprolyl isomerase [Pseudobdellovibrionaceae bacterium]